MQNEDQRPEGEEVAVVKVEPALPPTRLTDKHLVEVVEARNAFLNATRPLAIGCTRANQWNSFGGKTVRPDIGACNQIMRRFGISVKDTRFERMDMEDEKGAYYMYTCFATMALPNGIDSIESVGTCTSRDKFLGTNQTKGSRKHWEVAADHIMKKARTNCIVNGTMTMLGLDGLTKEDLKKYRVEGDVTEVTFGGGGQRATANTPQAASKPSGAPAPVDPQPEYDPNADMPAPQRKVIMDAFFAVVDRLTAMGVSEDELLAKYLVFNDQGEYPDRAKVKKFKTNKALNWLKRKTAEMETNEVVE